MRTLHTTGRNPAALRQTGLVCALLITLVLIGTMQNPLPASATSAPTESTIVLDTVGAPFPQDTTQPVSNGSDNQWLPHIACSSLNAFINECQAQSGKTLTAEQATQLITAAS